jgi:hypothetical protein
MTASVPEMGDAARPSFEILEKFPDFIATVYVTRGSTDETCRQVLPAKGIVAALEAVVLKPILSQPFPGCPAGFGQYGSQGRPPHFPFTLAAPPTAPS